MGNKIKYGLKNAHYAVVTEVNDVISHGTPVSIIGAVNIVQNAAGENVTFYADDRSYFEENTNNGYDGSIEMALIPDTFRVEVFGEELDANGALIENVDVRPNKIALMYEFDGDVNKTRHVNYYVIVSRPSIDSSTKTATKEPKTETMNISVRPAPDTGDVKGKLEQGKTEYDSFFSAVYLKNAVINTVALLIATFSKVAPTDIEINVTSSDVTNNVRNVKIDGVDIGGINLTATGVNVVLASAYVGALDDGVYIITVEFDKGNSVDVTLTVGA